MPLNTFNERPSPLHRYTKYSRRQRAALGLLLLWQRYPGRQWYCGGHDDTLWSPIALAAWLKRLDPQVY